MESREEQRTSNEQQPTDTNPAAPLAHPLLHSLSQSSHSDHQNQPLSYHPLAHSLLSGGFWFRFSHRTSALSLNRV